MSHPPAARLVVLSGPSGVGKSTLVAHARELEPGLWVSVSCTTRGRRPGERDGADYYFITPERFEQLVATGQLLEHAQFSGNRYGTPREPVERRLAAGLPALLEIELQGARQVRAAMPEARLVFLSPPSRDELRRRLTGRGTEAEHVIAARLERAEVELAAATEFDVVIVNDDVHRAALELIALLGPAGP